MHTLVAHLTAHYALDIADIQPAARGLVAETFVVTEHDGQRWFVKCCDNPLFKAHVVQSALAHAALADCVPHLINTPRRTTSGQGVSRLANTTVAVSTFIHAPLNEQYDTAAFGRIIGLIHQATPHVQVPMPQIRDFEHDALFRHLWKQTLDGHQQAWQRELSQQLAPYGALVAHQYRTLQQLAQHPQRHDPHPWVITHGDAGGNVIGHDDAHLKIIDWDYVGLAHPERDLWVFQYDERFWQGYQDVTGVQARSQYHLQCAAYRQYFDYMVYILSEIFRQQAHEALRVAHIDNLLSLFDERNWIQVHLKPIL